MPNLYKYRIYCQTDSKWEYIWNDIAPTTCPVNVAHTVNSNSIGELAQVRRIQEINDSHSPYTITGYNFYRCDTTTAAITVNLKSVTENKDRIIIIQNISGINDITIDPETTELIDSNSTYILSGNYGTVKIRSNGTEWVVVPIADNSTDDRLDGTLYDDNFEKGDVIINNGLDITYQNGAPDELLIADPTTSTGLKFSKIMNINVGINAAIDAFKIADGSVSNTEFEHINNLDQNLATTDDVTFNNMILTGTLNMSSNNITNVANPINPQDAATKLYVDSVAQGLDVKISVKVATTTALDLTTDFEQGDNVDGVILVAGNRILIKDQTNPIENGIYIIQLSGTPIRSNDLNNGKSAAGVFTFIEEGITNGDNGWICTNNSGTDIVGIDELEWTQFNGAGQIIPGDALSKSGNELNVNVDTTSIHVVSDALELVGKPISKGQILTYSTVQTSLAAASTNNYVLVSDNSTPTGLIWAELPSRTWIFLDSKSPGTNGGIATSGSWNTRTINTTNVDGGNEITRASNQLTLASGKYQVYIQSMFYRTQGTRTALYNVTNMTYDAYSLNAYASDADRTNIVSELKTHLILSTTTVYELRYRCNRTQNNDGLGIPTGINGVNEYYTIFTITKL